MTASAVFLDSGISIAFLDRSDRFHAAAVELMSRPPRRCHTSLAVAAKLDGSAAIGSRRPPTKILVFLLARSGDSGDRRSP